MTAPRATMINGFDASRLASIPEHERKLIERRQALLGPSYRLFYEEPLHLVRGEGVWLYDHAGKAYLDAYNNVPCIGHCHPRVVEAIAEQAAVLNTHTRYLDEALLDYSERLLATFPAELSRVMYTCTGSEAVDLALRIACFVTGGTGIIITESAYHGVTRAAAEISPSLGEAMPLGQHVLTIPAPDSYRGAGEDVGAAMARDVRAAIAFFRRRNIRPAAFIADSIFSTDGIFAEPAGFLKETLEAVHEAGAVYIADEVQPGFGRLGDGMWGFARHGIVPDIAVMGKPMGNGMPIAAAVMKPELQEEFGRKIRYFNTFGANHVSIAAASAVLSVIEEYRLIENAKLSGDALMTGMRTMQESDERIGDVRGAGLFVALEFVTDGESRTPDGALASNVVNEMRRRGVLISASGPHANVLKIRPPLPFSRDDAGHFLDVLSGVLADIPFSEHTVKQPGQYPPPDETDRGKPKAEQAYEYLRDAIISMRLAPNSIIAEKELCAELGISRTPLREAVLRLANEGLVAVVPGDGTFVSRISLRGVLQGYLVRSSIELRMVRLAARYYSEDFDRDFNILQFLQQDANRRPDHGLALRIDTEFHQLICRVAGFPDIWGAVHNATGQLDRLRYRAFDKQGMRTEIEEEHAAIHKALRAHDEDLAHSLLRKHLNDISEVIDFVKSDSPEILFMEEELDLATLLNA